MGLVGRLWETQRGVGTGRQGGRRAEVIALACFACLLASTLSQGTGHTLASHYYYYLRYVHIFNGNTRSNSATSFFGLHVSDSALSGGVVLCPGIYYTA